MLNRTRGKCSTAWSPAGLSICPTAPSTSPRSPSYSTSTEYSYYVYTA